MPKLDFVIWNKDEILETAKRLSEISKELTVIAYKLQGKIEVKEKADSSCDWKPL